MSEAANMGGTLHSDDNRKPGLRVAIMCNGMVFPTWQAEAIRHLSAVPGVQIVLLIVDGNNREPQAQSEAVYEISFRKRFYKALRDGTFIRKIFLNLKAYFL